MDKIYADPNVENDTTEHIRGKRLSSILKAPRNPLDDLGNGNELTQDINVEKRRKNSRRVSFANTIDCRVFQRDLKNNTAEGMNTLLHAPIRAAVPQTEGHDADYDVQGATRHDATLVFCDENEMDMTASHTAVITRNLHNSQADKTEKIDITSFLAGLNSNNGKAEMSKEFRFFSDPTSHSCPSAEQKEDTTAVKKIDFNEFLMSLKSKDKTPNPIEGPEKENIFCVPSQVSEDVAQSSADLVYSHKPPDSCNVTKVFGGQDDGMEMTKCQAPEVQDVFLGVAAPQQLPCTDITKAFADDGMDMTISHTAKMSFPFSSVGNQSLTCKQGFPSTELDDSVLQRASNQHLLLQHNPHLCTDKKTVNIEDRHDAAVLRAVKPEARTMAAIPGSISSETVFRGDKTGVFAKRDDVEITGNYTDVVCDSEKTTLFAEDADMDITRSHTISAESKVILQHRGSNNDVSIISGDKTCVFTHSDDMEISRFDSVAIDKPLGDAAIQEVLNTAGRAERKSLKGTGEKTVLFSLSNENNDMEITESHTAAIGQEIVSQKEGGHPASSAPPVKTVLLTSSQADEGTTKSCSSDKITVKVVCDADPNWVEEVVQQVLPNSEATVCALGDMEITKTRHVALEENALWGQAASRSVPVTATVLFTSYQADMEMTQLHTADESIEQVFCEDRSKLAKEVGQEAVPKSKSIVLPSAEDMEITRTHAAVLRAADVGTALKDKYQGIKVPLGIFPPKLPNRRNPSVSSVQDVNTISTGKGETLVSEVSVNTRGTLGSNKTGRQNFSPSRFIVEEFLPVCLEEMDSNESVSSELVENACSEVSKNQISHDEKNQFEETGTCNHTKRALEQDEEDLQSPKKVKWDEDVGGEAPQDLQSPDCTHASSSSSLDSVKADTELTIQRSSQMESQLFTDSFCEETLRQKFQSGVITVGEFFTLLQVHVPIQKPRHSHIAASDAVGAPATPEELMYSQYVYRPKLRIYEADCQALSQKIDELKPYANIQDQLLVNVNRSLWEVMRTCSDEELKSFGAELNKMKSYFTKESKILAHNEKATLYSKLLQSAQEERGKLQSRIEKVDELLKEAESCLSALEAGSDWEGQEADHWEGQEADHSDGAAQGKSLEAELERIEAQEEELQRELAMLESENEQMLVQMNHLREKEKSLQELLERCEATEWEITEWSQQQAVFSFLYDAVELTVVFGPPIDGDDFGEDPARKIVSLNFESLLDEEKAPPSSCLVQRLIFQFIESQGCWQEKCPMLYYLPQVLHDVSVVVSHCKTLGEEIEFLERWGGKFHLLKTDINDTKVKLLFSSSLAFAKFELSLSLSANYPAASLPLTVQNQIGNIGEEEIAAVLSNVPTGPHYLRRI
ncbi:PREDICTED: protein CASC5, partial [Buceros rhinoceros silvestris]|uniref:protein CASC5 n=1 Tax=Buceros rhinoceros silvestris TaxID=175836 RepID=UPI000528FF6E